MNRSYKHSWIELPLCQNGLKKFQNIFLKLEENHPVLKLIVSLRYPSVLLLVDIFLWVDAFSTKFFGMFDFSWIFASFNSRRSECLKPDPIEVDKFEIRCGKKYTWNFQKNATVILQNKKT